MPSQDGGTLVLTEEERSMLDGGHGEAVSYAMRIQVGLGKVFGARRMVPIGRAHVALSAQDADCWFVEKLVNMGGRCRVSPMVNPNIDLAYLDEHDRDRKSVV